jgi:hypothetical protein
MGFHLQIRLKDELGGMLEVAIPFSSSVGHGSRLQGRTIEYQRWLYQFPVEFHTDRKKMRIPARMAHFTATAVYSIISPS